MLPAREGPGSQGLVVELKKALDAAEGEIFGHVFNGQNVNGTATFVDRTHMLGDVSNVENWFFFPIQ